MGLSTSYRTSAKSLWHVLLQPQGGNIFLAVLPFCLGNCGLLFVVELLGKDGGFGVSPTGHGLMTLLVSFLVISKVNLAYERFREARRATGAACLQLRELHQLVVTVSAAAAAAAVGTAAETSTSAAAATLQTMEYCDSNDSDNYNINNSINNISHKAILQWRQDCFDRIVQLLEATQTVLQEDGLAEHLARNETLPLRRHRRTDGCTPPPYCARTDDPMALVQSLHLHLYTATAAFSLALLERFNLVGKLNEFSKEYSIVLDLSSTPMPFALVQMGRAFLFLWTFSMPLVLRQQGPFTDLWTAAVFLFFLTYGFIGLELVSMKLSMPFGNGAHDDINVAAMCEATEVGMAHDFEVWKESFTATTTTTTTPTTVSQRRLTFRCQKEGTVGTGTEFPSDGRFGSEHTHTDIASVYHAMPSNV